MQPCLSTIITEMLESVKSTEGITVRTAHTPPRRSPPIPHTAGAVTPPYPTPQVTPNTTHSRGRHPSIPHPTGHPQYHTQQELSPLHTPPRRSIPHPAGHPQYHTQQGPSPLHTPPRRSPPIPHTAGAVTPPYPTPQVTPNTTHSRGRHPSIPHPTGHPQYHTQQELSPLHTPPRRSPPIPHTAGAVTPPYPTPQVTPNTTHSRGCHPSIPHPAGHPQYHTQQGPSPLHTPPRRSPPIPHTAGAVTPPYPTPHVTPNTTHSRGCHPSIPHPTCHPQYHTQQGLSPLHTPPRRSPPIPHTAGAVTPPYPTPQVTPNTTHSRGRHPSIPHPAGHPQYHTQQGPSPLHTPPPRSPPIPHTAGAVTPPYPTDHCSQCSDI